MTYDALPLQDARILLSLARLKRVRNRKVLDLFCSAAERRNNLTPRDIFLSLAEEWSGVSSTYERAWEESGFRLQRTCDAGIQVIPFFGSEYPKRLRQIDDPPVVLFVKGEIQALHASESIAIVGTREPTNLGERAAESAGRLAAEAGIAVISGLALGCDTKAHRGCVDANGIGVAVLANGLDRVYPAGNRDLAKQILDCGGCLVSESPVGTKLTRWAFAYRDRIQSGLSDRVLVIETDVKGGTMHTVKYSRRQQRPLACINHPEQFLSDSKTRGNQMLIHDGAAVGISDLEELGRFVTGAPFPMGTVPSDETARKGFLWLEKKVGVIPPSETTVESISDSTPVTKAMPTQNYARGPTEAVGYIRSSRSADSPKPAPKPRPEVEQLRML